MGRRKVIGCLAESGRGYGIFTIPSARIIQGKAIASSIGGHTLETVSKRKISENPSNIDLPPIAMGSLPANLGQCPEGRPEKQAGFLLFDLVTSITI